MAKPLDDQVFWDRLVDMPHVEALDELRARRVEIIQERADAEASRGTRRWDMQAEFARAASLSRVNAEMKRRNTLQSQTRLRDAVIAVFGAEGYELCKVWMASKDPLSNGD